MHQSKMWFRSSRWSWARRIVLLVSVFATHAEAMCDVIPSARESFRGALGSVDRPFAIPDELGQFIVVNLGGECTSSSPGFPGTENDYWVTILLRPPNGASETVTLTTSDLPGCEAALGAGQCELVPVGSGIEKLSSSALRFRVPDTDARFLAPADGLAWTGPAAIVVTDRGVAPPSSLASSDCASCLGDPPGCGDLLVACIDTLYENDGTCAIDGIASYVDRAFPSFTLLPRANDFGSQCTTVGSVCGGSPTQLRFTIDSAGNALVPWDYRSVLVQGTGVPVARAVSGEASLAGFGSLPPGPSLLTSHAPGGQLLPPIFFPVADPGTSDPGDIADIRLFGTVDAPVGVMRIARRSDSLTQCRDGGGLPVPLPCEVDTDCPSSHTCEPAECYVAGTPTGITCSGDGDCGVGEECGPSLFDFSTSLVADSGGNEIGPILINAFTLDVEDVVPIDGVFESESALVSVVHEAILEGDCGGGGQGADLNNDGDCDDHTARILSRETGEVVLLPGSGGPAPGRSVVRLRNGRLRTPAIAVDGGIVAYLQPEPNEGGLDENLDGDVFDTLLKLVEVQASPSCGSPPCIVDIDYPGQPAGTPIAVDAAPRVDRSPMAFSGGRLFFRAAEGDNAPKTLSLAKALPGQAIPIPGGVPGPFTLAFSGLWHLLAVRDLAAMPVVPPGSRLSILDRIGATLTPVDDDNGVYGDWFWSGAISGDGGTVLLETVVAAPPSAPGASQDVFARDLNPYDAQPELISVADGGGPGNGASDAASVTSEGRYVVFESHASNLLPPGLDTNGATDVFRRDRFTNQTIRVNQLANGGEAVSGSLISISDDGRFAAFAADGASFPCDLIEGVYLRDLELSSDPICIAEGTGLRPVIAGGGEYVAFVDRDNAFPSDSNGIDDVAVYHVETGEVDLVSVGPTGQAGDGFSRLPSISQDGRFLTFQSDASDLVPGISSAFFDVFRHDRVTGLTERVTDQSNAQLTKGSLSGDGRTVVFGSNTAYVPEDTNGANDTYLWAHDPLETGYDATGDGRVEQVALFVYEPGVGLTPLCAADEVATHDGSAAFLRPESGGTATHCPDGPNALSPSDFDGDGSLDDSVVHIYDSGVVTNTGGTATAIAMSGVLGALRDAGGGSESAFFWDGTTWQPTGIAAEEIQATEDWLALRNANDELIVFDTVSETAISLGVISAEYVANDSLLVYRLDEQVVAADLNGDGDQVDLVLHVYDAESNNVFNTQFAALPCTLSACDPRTPYAVSSKAVSFLVAEIDQENGGFLGFDCLPSPTGCDLDGNGRGRDIVKKVFKVDEARALLGGAAPLSSATTLAVGDCVATVESIGAGVCADDGSACVSYEDGGNSCNAAVPCLRPPGVCLGAPATPQACDAAALEASGGVDPCGPGEICHLGTCKNVDGTCADTAQCSASFACSVSGAEILATPAPVRGSDQEGRHVAYGVGVCVVAGAACAFDSDCSADRFCGVSGTCERRFASCAIDADCDAGQTCSPSLRITGSGDRDADGITDAIDNCKSRSNAVQLDLDADGLGDACDRQTCGNGVQEYGEACDHAGDNGVDGVCSATCQYVGSGPACSDGIDNDGDGGIDLADASCDDAFDTNERGSIECDDGLDNDGDYLSDFPSDPACTSPTDVIELPEPRLLWALLAGAMLTWSLARRRRV